MEREESRHMQRRVVSLWLPTFATDRLCRQTTSAAPSEASGTVGPLATVANRRGAERLIAVDGAAQALGLRPGMALADARAVVPALHVRPADPAAKHRSLERLADWCQRYTPWTAADPDGGMTVGGSAGLWLDIGGCAHLFGGEAALLADLAQHLAGCGLACRAAAADTPGAAWALARFTRQSGIAATGTAAALAPLPLAALRLEADSVAALARVGLHRIGDLLGLPRAPLAARFGAIVVQRLDQALGQIDEPISPKQAVPDLRLRLAFAEPISRREDIAAALDRLLADLCARLALEHSGVRRLDYVLFRADGTTAQVSVGTGRPLRDPVHLARLFADKLDELNPGFGVDMAMLAAGALDPLAPAQQALGRQPGSDADGLARLVDRLGNRLGPQQVVRLEARASHIPEHACRPVPAFDAPPCPVGSNASRGFDRPRPLRLLPWPEPIEAMVPLPDHPPLLFRWRHRPHRVARAEGPERIGAEWWQEETDPLTADAERLRDYYRVEDADGDRLWLYRQGLYRPDRAPRWYLHGFFG